MKLRRLRALPLAIGLLLVACSDQAPPVAAVAEAPPSAPRETFPPFTLPTLDGKEWSLADHRGKVVFINYWAHWCGPCRMEMPDLVAVNQAMKGDMIVVGISVDNENMDAVRRFVEEYKVDYPILIPPAGDRNTKIASLPTSYLVDKEGRVALKITGPIGGQELVDLAEPLLKE